MINLFNKKELHKGINFLALKHPIIIKLKNKYGEPNFNRGTTGIFHSLIRSIISQQISTKAASSVHTKFKAIFPKKKFIAQDILKAKDSKLKLAGLSHQNGLSDGLKAFHDYISDKKTKEESRLKSSIL